MLEAKVFVALMVREFEITTVKVSEDYTSITTRPKQVLVTLKPRN
jgi:hypothetical protein